MPTSTRSILNFQICDGPRLEYVSWEEHDMHLSHYTSPREVKFGQTGITLSVNPENNCALSVPPGWTARMKMLETLVTSASVIFGKFVSVEID